MIRILIIFAIATISYADKNSRIVGGENAEISEIPYQVALLYYSIGQDRPRCGGSIINRYYVLTAAHCVLKPGTYKVRIGSTWSNEGGIVKEVAEIIKHPKSEWFFYDFALLRLKTQISEYGPSVNKIALPAADYKLETGSEAMISGWGSLSENGEFSKNLQKAVVSLIDLEECRKIYGDRITDEMICATGGTGTEVVDSCQGK
jgi:hypothetical protein